MGDEEALRVGGFVLPQGEVAFQHFLRGRFEDVDEPLAVAFAVDGDFAVGEVQVG